MKCFLSAVTKRVHPGKVMQVVSEEMQDRFLHRHNRHRSKWRGAAGIAGGMMACDFSIVDNM
jgi:hypothetical protein